MPPTTTETHAQGDKIRADIDTVTMSATPTASFWLCPACSKHVPTRQTSCKCGFDRAVERAAVPVVGPRTQATSQTVVEDAAFPWGRVVTLFGVGVAFAGALYVSRKSPKRPSAEVIAVPRVQQQRPEPPPQYVFVPVPMQAPPAGESQPSPPLDPATHRELIEQLQTQSSPIAIEQQARRDETQREDEAQREREALQRRQQEQEAEDRKQEQFWRSENDRVVAQLRAAFSAYRYQFCAESRGGIGLLSAPGDTRGQYLAAREMARNFEEGARVAGARRFVRLDWNEFPQPEELGLDPKRLPMALMKWHCPK